MVAVFLWLLLALFLVIAGRFGEGIWIIFVHFLFFRGNAVSFLMPMTLVVAAELEEKSA